jgi:hypothetical protein
MLLSRNTLLKGLLIDAVAAFGAGETTVPDTCIAAINVESRILNYSYIFMLL